MIFGLNESRPIVNYSLNKYDSKHPNTNGHYFQSVDKYLQSQSDNNYNNNS